MSSPKTVKPLHWALFFIFLIGGVALYAQGEGLVGGDYAWLISLSRSFMLLAAIYLFFERLFRMALHYKILLGMVFGALAGWAFGAEISELKPLGTAFIRLIQMIVVPLVLSSLIVGTASLGDITKMKRIGGKTVFYYLASTAFAITVGLLLANFVLGFFGNGMTPEVQQGLLASFSEQAGSKLASAQANHPSAVDTFLNMIPKNPFEALSGGEMLQVIFFAIFSGVALTLIPKEKGAPVIAFFDGISELMIKIVLLVIEMAPYGVFALIADVAGSQGFDVLRGLAVYTVVTALGLIIMIGVYPVVQSFFSRIPPLVFLKEIRQAQLIAFSTSSSGATLPVTMEVAEDQVGISKQMTSFVLPLGATVNMDGTALYQGVATMFIASWFGMELGISQQLTIVLTATLASIGTAAAPGVGILMLVIILQQLGIPLEGIALILAVDRILDMMRTVVNVTSDLTAATIVAATEAEQLRARNE
ncbi:MAG TPA: dicarboxylate/amino acid:cation symporter [Calditrichia bacterium]|nr:dicarboxylate/amino acid:cation symporter [Calditrichia bacterium]HQV31675.1 dicarboxylate/amino acid:cation symporter [Calditrichia bacterium]